MSHPTPGNHPKACPEWCIYGDHREKEKGVDGVIPTKAQSQWPAWGSLPETPSRCFLLLHSIVCLLRIWQAFCKTMWDARPYSEGKAPVGLSPDNYMPSSVTFLAHDSSKCVFKLLSLIKPQRPQQQDYKLERVHAQFASFKWANKWDVPMAHQEKGIVRFFW